jgi:hypothetical protein
MRDLESTLRDSLRAAAAAYTPADVAGARERFRQRRRRRSVEMWTGAAAVVGAAAAVAFLMLPAPVTDPGPARVRPALGPTRAVVAATIRVADGPSGVAVGDGFAWTASARGGVVSKIDPARDAVVETFPVERADDVQVRSGYAWVVSEKGALTRVATTTGTVEQLGVVGEGGHLDIAAGLGDIWLQESGAELHRIDAATGEEVAAFGVGSDPTDVSVMDGTIWIYDRASGRVLRVAPGDGDVLDSTVVGVTASQDLRSAAGFTWFFRGKDGTLLQLAQDTGDVVQEIPLGGTFGAVAAGEDAIYVMVTEGGATGTGEGTLYRIDADSAEQLGEPVALSGVPFDVEAGEGAVWVTHNESDSVTRIGFEPAR